MNIYLCEVLHAGFNFLPHFCQKLSLYFAGESGSHGSVSQKVNLRYEMKRPNCWLTFLLISEAKPLQPTFRKSGVFTRDVFYYLVFFVFGFWH